MDNGSNSTDNSVNGKPDKARFRRTAARLASGQSRLTHRASIDWIDDQRTVCDVHRAPAVLPLDDLLATMGKSRTAAALMAAIPHLSVVYDAQTPIAQFYQRADKSMIIALHPHRPAGDIINALSRELRRAWHAAQGSLLHPMAFEPDEAILVNRAQQADALMVSIRIAWELKLQEQPEAWNYLSGSPAADVGRTFEMKAQTDFRTLNNGAAARAAYDKFFEDARTKIFDKRLIHLMLLDEVGYMKCTKPRPRLSADHVRRLGDMPAGKNYFSATQARAPNDLAYATIEDRSNANFLWFIKFERSFVAKEREMLEKSVKLSAEIVDFAKWSLRGRRTTTHLRD